MDSKQLLDNLSTHLKNAIARGIALAASLAADAVTPAHLLLSISEENGSMGADILKKLRLAPEAIRNAIMSAAACSADKSISTTSLPQLSPAAKHALEKAMLVAYERSHSYVGTEHLLYGLLHSGDQVVNKILEKSAVAIESAEEYLDTVFQGTSKFPDSEEMDELAQHMEHIMEQPLDAMPAAPTHKKSNHAHAKKQPSALEIFTTNLTSKETQARIDPVIGRDQEIERLIHILCRRTKNNPMLVGEAGVGKTAIVEGLAKKIYDGEVPDILKRKKILSLDLALLIAGTIYRGEFEARLRQIIDEVSRDPNVLLFIDEMHNIVGAGSNGGTMDAANLLKPALARGLLRCIGATTIDEYQKHIKTDPALERRLQPIFVHEPSQADTEKILRGVAPYYESFHGAKIDEDAIRAAVRLSSKYIHDNYLPDKAIDLLDEAAAKVRAARKFGASEKKIQNLEERIASMEQEKESAIHEEAFDKAMKLKNNIAACEKELSIATSKRGKRPPATKQRIRQEDIAAVLSARLGIDANTLLTDEWQALETLAERLSKHIVGQTHAIDKIVQKLRHSHLRPTAAGRPFASFLFAGPSGVGKTALAKVLARELYQDDKALIQFDMSEFSEGHSVSKILGSPAGYIGFNERNRFTEEIRRRPYSVILLDEFDKAHPDVRRLLLQMLDEGELTDSRGKKISFAHAIIILTTNIGAEIFASGGIGFGNTGVSFSESDRSKTITNKLKEEFGAALISRLGNICLFAPLSQQHIAEIIKRQISELSSHLSATRNVSIFGDQTALERLAKEHYSPDLGARHIEQAVEQVIHDLLVPSLRQEKRKKTFTLTTTPTEYKLV